MKQLKHFIFVPLLLLIGLGHPQRQTVTQTTPVVISDGTFNDGDWSIFKVESVGGSSHTVQQSPNGVNPDAFRLMTHTLQPAPPGVLNEILVTHLFGDNNYSPFLDGPIDHIDYGEEGIMLSLPWPDAFSETYLALVQDGRLYISNDYIRFIGNSFWQNKTLANLTANDFAADDGSLIKPDFSASGGVIQFGYTRRNSRSETLPPFPPDQDLVYEHGIDNWTVTIFPGVATPGNTAPVAISDQYVIDMVADGKMLFVLKNDSDPDGDRLSIIEFTLPKQGSLEYHERIEALFYVRTGGGGWDSFTYTVTDGQLTDTAIVHTFVDCG